MASVNKEKYEYGIDKDIKKRLDAKMDPNRLAEAQRWVEGVTGEKFKGSFHDSLKSGVLLCRLVNKVKPGSVPENRISLSNMPFNQRENVAAYLDACRRLGVREADMFVTADLFEGNNLVAVVNNLYALGGVAQGLGFRGPHLGIKPAEEAKREVSRAQAMAARAMPTAIAMGSAGAQEKAKEGGGQLDKIIRNPDEFAASRGGKKP